MLWGEIDEDYWDDPAADEWRPLIADFLEQGDFPEDAAAQVRLPALYEKRILWLGRFANGLLLSFPCALLLLLIKRDARTFRRGTRLRIGHCPVCDYDLRSGGGVEAGCPECGWSREDAEN